MNLQLPFIEERQAAFRPIHYLGNKSRILDAIEDVVIDVSGPSGMVCDLFSGSGVVAQRFAQSRPVVAADIQEYARVVTSALVDPRPPAAEIIDKIVSSAQDHVEAVRPRLSALIEYESEALAAVGTGELGPLCEILECGSLYAFEWERPSQGSQFSELLSTAADEVPRGPSTVISRYYGGLYFSYEQAITIDGIAFGLQQAPPECRDTVLAALLSTVSSVVSTVGNQFAQPVRPRGADGTPKARLVSTIVRTRQRPILTQFREWLTRYSLLPRASRSHRVIRADFRSTLDELPDAVTVVYADPPYTRDHYSRFYHVLETLALGDEPAVSTMRVGRVEKLSRALYREERHQSPFCIRSQVKPTFADLFERVSRLNVPLVLSYSPYSEGTVARPQTRLLSVADLVELAGEYFKTVGVQDAGRIAHSKLNAQHLNASMSYSAESFVVAAP